MANNILQWNVRGFEKRKINIYRIITERRPQIICLQETNFKHDFCANIRGYTNYYKNRITRKASGGVVIYVKNDINSRQINLNTPLEAIAATCYLPHKITICNVYLPDSRPLNKQELENLKNQLPEPFVILGDFNARNHAWGSKTTDTRGKVVENLMDDSKLVLLNENQPTYFNVANDSESSIDLTFASASISDNLLWEVSNDLHNSDHYPICTKVSGKDTEKEKDAIQCKKVELQ